MQREHRRPSHALGARQCLRPRTTRIGATFAWGFMTGRTGLEADCAAQSPAGHQSNGLRRMMVSARSGPVEIMSMGAPTASSMRVM